MRVVVVGAGAWGGWTAWHLLARGAEVTLVDPWGAGNSRSSSGGETRVIRTVYGPDRIYVEMVARAFSAWKEFGERWDRDFYRRTGVLWMCSQDAGYVRESIPIAQDLGFSIEQRELTQVRRQFPQINFAGVENVFFESEAGYLLAREACREVARRFVMAGGTFLPYAAEFAPRGDQVDSLRLSSGDKIEADAFVFACGPWMPTVLPDLLGTRIQPTRQEVYYFGPPIGFGDDLPIWIEFGEDRYYGIPNADGRGFKVADDMRGEAFDPTTGDREPTSQGIDKARKFLGHRFPILAQAPLLEARVCQYENSPDGHYLLDRHPDFENVVVAAGGSGHGFKLGPVIGEEIALSILDDKPLPREFAFSRFDSAVVESTQFDH